MSSLDSTDVLVTSRARADLADILRFTVERWGSAQMEAYRKELDRALRRLARHPASGRPAPEISPAHRILPVGSHLIVYRLSGQRIAVLRVLHQRMHPSAKG